jgi:cob(I)alamin adenosyltransferase
MHPKKNHPGDDGTTGILGKGRLPKYHLQIETMGCLDEATASLGMVRSVSSDKLINEMLKQIQHDLYLIMTEAAIPSGEPINFPTLEKDRLEWLESQNNAIASNLPERHEFIFPGDSPYGAALALARTIIRRAERRMVELISCEGSERILPVKYLNRLSTLCFTLELQEREKLALR